MAVSDEIAKIEALLNEGTNRVTTDGLSVSYSLAELRRRLEQLKRREDQTRRPRLASIDLSKAW